MKTTKALDTIRPILHQKLKFHRNEDGSFSVSYPGKHLDKLPKDPLWTRLFVRDPHPGSGREIPIGTIQEALDSVRVEVGAQHLTVQIGSKDRRFYESFGTGTPEQVAEMIAGCLNYSIDEIRNAVEMPERATALIDRQRRRMLEDKAAAAQWAPSAAQWSKGKTPTAAEQQLERAKHEKKKADDYLAKLDAVVTERQADVDRGRFPDPREVTASEETANDGVFVPRSMRDRPAGPAVRVGQSAHEAHDKLRNAELSAEQYRKGKHAEAVKNLESARQGVKDQI